MDSSLEDSLLSCIVSEKPNVKWEDVVGLETAKAELQEAIIFPTRFPQIFRGTRQARRAVLLHGPSGTGKSYLAKAAATEAGLALFSVRCGDVGAKRMGQGENLMGQLFTLAREKKPSIVFIDELDTVCGKQDSKDANGETSTRIRTEFLVQMEANNNDGVFVLAATNRPWSLDPAVQRRFQKRLHRCVHVPLPDEEARSKLFKFHLGDTASSLDNAEEAFRDLAQKTAGFSSRDISDLVQAALMTPVKKVHAATYFRKASPPILQQNNMLTRPLQFRDRHGEWYTPCNPFEDGATLMKWDKVPARQLKEPTLTLADLYNAVAKARPSVGEEEVRKCSEWTRQYAMESA
ncbi:P-loop containing nucleoside triphosphate hydrolase protein [Dactylonectria estremocensis]|uniref:P-loop containing nucleoside triphosphate hydrolase protein n=1 Tax=Dactylonectria estremocensis TaxID=1079267 RepID=A0A9P9EWA6_9HYPO|nr:P-loop containing nucleoside triphosphate hydrolase protein [Dactylonectria estremocensis]